MGILSLASTKELGLKGMISIYNSLKVLNAFYRKYVQFCLFIQNILQVKYSYSVVGYCSVYIILSDENASRKILAKKRSEKY